MYDDYGTSFVYANTDVLVVVPLRDEVGSPWAPKSDEETWDDEDVEGDEKEAEDEEGEDTDDDGDEEAVDDDVDEGDQAASDEDEAGEDNGDGKEEGEDKETEPVVIELDDFERRALKIPVDRGDFYNLAVAHNGKLIYTRGAVRGSGDKPSIKLFDLEDEKKEEKTVVKEAGAYRISADGKKLLVRKDKTMAIVKAAADQKLDKPLSLVGMTARVDPRAEWRQVFTDAWRIQRDFFYDPNMHGLDWKAVREHYAAMLEDCVSRRDVAYVIGEMIAELNVGHAYVRGTRDLERGPKVSVGMLGADFELHDGAYRITEIHEGGPWDLDARGPLSQPNIDVKEGDYLLAVNGVQLDTGQDPWFALQRLAGKTVTLTVSEKPTIDEDARDVIIKPISSERTLRFRAWIEGNRKYVEERTDGKVGYIYVTNTSISGQNDLVRQFFGQRNKAALIIDERWNGGGQIPTRFIELLNRPVTNYWANRDGTDTRWPPDSHPGPKCMLINGLAGSGGDAFPFYFRQAGLGKLIGTRTWGGLVGMAGNPGLIDGGYVSVPMFAFYEKDGTWGIEGHGVDPDIEVVDDPSLMVDGGDPQLDAAIEHMLAEIKRSPYTQPRRPAYPDRSGMGVREEDR
jgi:tricorn protease